MKPTLIPISVLMTVSSMAQASPTPGVPLLEMEQFTVRELMRLDAERALEVARQQRGWGPGEGVRSRAGPAAQGATANDRNTGGVSALRLAGVYGVGERLTAEVHAGSQILLFRKGRAHPVGYAADRWPYRLEQLAGACVNLHTADEKTVLCLSGNGDQ